MDGNAWTCEHCGEAIFPVVHSNPGNIWAWSTDPEELHPGGVCEFNTSYPLNHEPDATINVVWGPSAEWGDGVGVKGYYRTSEWADESIKQEKANDVEYAYEYASSLSVDEFRDELREHVRRGWGDIDESSIDEMTLEDLSDDELTTIFGGWPTNMVGYHVSEESLGYFRDLPYETVAQGLDTVVDYLNGNLD